MLTASTRILKIILRLLLVWQSSNFLSDSCTDMLLKTLKRIFVMMNSFIQSLAFDQFTESFPSSLYMAWKILSLDRDIFDKYIVCPTCASLYNPKDFATGKETCYSCIELKHFSIDGFLVTSFVLVNFGKPLTFGAKETESLPENIQNLLKSNSKFNICFLYFIIENLIFRMTNHLNLNL